MNNLYNHSDVNNLLERLKHLTVDSKRQWGTMTVDQMLAHCNVSLETAMGLNFPKRKFIGRIFGKLIKLKFLDKKPMVKNSITEDFYITDKNNFEFEKERKRAIELISTFYQNGPEKCTTHPHSYFGKLTPYEWAVLKWKHYDHHLRQFGL
ncbi:DUF1569 domain-containing protein [Urechidicola croceus]|uniref:DUF1569 domain-containing protein n=1 Tax=Urechidicola croceus TaxID=1850246 RepID=A0A1D8P6I0_9FLAO|nr:DUF1569 domain-containing protein [Urechidicola croceus]AOW20176.1 hypothetical protein LPB138_05550 [Urechidicola croceus]